LLCPFSLSTNQRLPRRYSCWLQAGRFVIRTPVRERCSAPVQTGSEPHTTSCTTGKEALTRR
jgi:hypothetical protein